MGWLEDCENEIKRQFFEKDAKQVLASAIRNLIEAKIDNALYNVGIGGQPSYDPMQSVDFYERLLDVAIDRLVPTEPNTHSKPENMPVRVQRKRTKGWRTPENTRCVTRPGRFGNPFETADAFREAMAVCQRDRCVPGWMDFDKGQRILWILEHLDELEGQNLACYCGLDTDCHADVLLEYANSHSVQR